MTATPAAEGRQARNADQATLAQHLIDTARDHLAGRDADGVRLIDARPRERIVLGVLQPQPLPIAVPTSSAGDVPYEPGVPVDHLPASEMGLTALIDTTESIITLRVRAHFAMYLQHAPTHSEQAEHSGLVDDRSADIDGLPPLDEETSTESVDPDGPGRTSPLPLPEQPGEADLARLSPQAADAVRLAVAGARAPVADSPKRPGRRQSDYLRPVYCRYDVAVEHDLVVPIPHDARPHTNGEVTAYTDAVQIAIEPMTPARTGEQAGALLVPMTGSSALRIPRDVVQAGAAAYEAYLQTSARPDWSHPLPQITFRATVQRTPDRQLRLALTLVNDTPEPARDRGFLPEVAIYDAGFEVALDGAAVVASEYRLVERDYRTEPLVHAHGRFCCLDEDIFREFGHLATTTLPIHRQMVYESKPELQPTFVELAIAPLPPLERIEQHMAAYASDWDRYLETAEPGAAQAACQADRDAFGDEIRRFRRGLQLIREDLSGAASGLGVAFERANESFALMNTRGGLDDPQGTTATTWRLFQVVYVVANLAALAAREAPATDRVAWLAQRQAGDHSHDARFADLDELAIADVLWFPTGGGKSAALYGLVAVGLFFDRLRGKHAGVSSVIRFPLRMLSVQQLERMLRLIAACEMTRDAHADPGEPFRLGYWVGHTNTPNRITDPNDERWRDLASMSRQGDDWKREKTVLPTCPYCGASAVSLAPDIAAVTLAHRCGNCGKTLPVDVSDDEVYRHLPAVLVGTVDKIASLAFNAHASHLTHGPAFRCPDHGFVTHPQGYARRCLARDACSRTEQDWLPVSIKDPAPALVIQDELHLLSEELGTFAAHYETLWQHLCTVGSGLPSKVLAATATISDYENQVAQLYALTPRRFPTDGWVDGDSFYAARHDDLVQRIFVGALPTQMDVVQFAIAAGEAMRREVVRLTDLPAVDVLALLGLRATPATEVRDLLFRYELQCFYCNRKTHADHVHARAERYGRTIDPGFRSVRLNGQTPLAEISDVIRQVERQNLGVPASERLACIAGTSLISHGVDLERLNVLFVLGMPSTVAYYVQATSRAGRTDVGIVFTSLGRHFVRDRSVFHFFDAQHRYVNVLVEPVALNRFSTHGPRKTASGIVAALLAQQWARDPDLLQAAGLPARADLTRADTVRTLLTFMQARAAEGAGPDPVELMQVEARRAYGLDTSVLDPHVADRFADSVNRGVASLLASVMAVHETLLSKSLRPRPPTSLRDVDASAEFGVTQFAARRRFEFLGGSVYDDDEADFAVAQERD